MNETTTGIVQVAGRNKFGSYLKVNDAFFNAGKSLKFDLATLQKGQAVTFQNNGKYINSIEVSGEGAVHVPTHTATAPSLAPSTNKNVEIARSTAVKAVLGSPMIAQMYKTKDVSEAVSDTKLIIESFTNYIVTGSWVSIDEKETVNA